MIYPSYKRPIHYINNTPYVVHAIIPIHRIKDVRLVKEWLGCDTAFKLAREVFDEEGINVSNMDEELT